VSYRQGLPQLEDRLFLTDGGIETTLIFHRGLDLPLFAAFVLLKAEAGAGALREYYEPYVALADEQDLGFVLESPTWRANPRWAAELGYSTEQLDRANREAIALMETVRSERKSEAPSVISGCIGPHDDGYNPSVRLSADQAEEYHAQQIGTFSDTAADMVTAITMTYPDEAIGIVRAATAAGIPAAISFTLETDGRLPNGQALGDAIEEVDGATDNAAAYFMINCAHPTHFEDVVQADEPWRERIRGLRANASMRSHAELDEAEDLDEGDPAGLGARYAALTDHLRHLNVVGGCCGTDHRHVGEIRDAFPGREDQSGFLDSIES
jgi:S-methylmethionine-dependent homocysteine/selenocysteine methylase